MLFVKNLILTYSNLMTKLFTDYVFKNMFHLIFLYVYVIIFLWQDQRVK